MKNALNILAVALLAPLGFSGCTMPPAIHGNGVLITEMRDVSDFHRVSIGGSGRALITQGDTEGLQITADENLLPYIESEVRQGELRIWTKRGNLRFSKAPIYTLNVRELDQLHLSGALQAEMESLKTDRFRASISGSGKVDLGRIEAESLDASVSGSGSVYLRAGKVSMIDMGVSGSGELQAENVEARKVGVSISGSGEARVWATESLDAHISGSGDVRYKGTPQVTQSVSGSGRIRAMP